MTPLAHRLVTTVLQHVLNRPCESTIPRSGEKGAAVNCYVTAIDKGDDPYLVVRSLNNGQLSCLKWDGSNFSTSVAIPLDNLHLRDFHITHYYGLAEVSYHGIIDFVLMRITCWPYLKIHLVQALSHVDQYLFNKKKLITKQRKELLKVLVEHALEGHTEHEPLDLMTSLYSIKWFSHPHGEQAQSRLEFYLDSLVETGELKKTNYKYVLTGHALRAIEEYEEEERKHTENVKMQWRMFWLAFAVAALTVVQAGLVKLPPLIDLTSSVKAK